MPTYTALAAGTPNTFGVAPGVFGAPLDTPGISAPLVNGAPAPNVPLNVVPRDIDTPYVQSFNVQLQQQLLSNMLLSLGYVGSLGRQLPYVQELNAALPGAGLAGLPFAAAGRTASTSLFANGLTSNYNALQAGLSKRFSHGLAFQAAYTWSKALGYTSGIDNRLLNPFDRQANYGPLDYDRQHVLTISHLWELPFGPGKNYADTGMLARILADWEINGIFSWATGTPLTITANPLLCNCPNNTAFADVTGVADVTGNVGPGSQFLNPALFVSPAPGTAGNLTSRGIVRGPGYRTYDMSLFRNFSFMDRYRLEIRGEVYNLTNSPRFVNPVTDVNSSTFGQVTGTLNNSFGRQFNLAARFRF
jgi:hypothetical protein